MKKKKRIRLKRCKSCGRYGVEQKVVDVDGHNLVDVEICKFCGAGTPALL